MIGSHYFESVGEIYVGTGKDVGNTERRTFTLPFRGHMLLGACERSNRHICLSKGVIVLQLLHIHMTKSILKPFTQGQI